MTWTSTRWQYLIKINALEDDRKYSVVTNYFENNEAEFKSIAEYIVNKDLYRVAELAPAIHDYDIREKII